MTDFIETRAEPNEKFLRTTKSSGDLKLDREAYNKTIDEKERGVLLGPFASVQDVPFF